MLMVIVIADGVTIKE